MAATGVDRRTLLTAALATGIGAPLAQAQPADELARGPIRPDEIVPLWAAAPPAPAGPLTETIDRRSADANLPDRAIHGISQPRMAVFRSARPNGAAVLIMPGGGYTRVVIDREGYELAQWLSARGFAAFVLFYRLPGEGWADRSNVPLADAQRAMRLIRGRADHFGIDPARVAAMGFSAGGHLCSDLAARFAMPAYAARDAHDALSARPLCAAPIYPVVSMHPPLAHPGSRRLLLGDDPGAALESAHSPDENVPEHPCPHFLCHAEDDPVVPVINTLRLRDALRARGGACETHLFETGGHGFGLRLAQGKPVAAWIDLWLGWARAHGLAA